MLLFFTFSYTCGRLGSDGLTPLTTVDDTDCLLIYEPTLSLEPSKEEEVIKYQVSICLQASTAKGSTLGFSNLLLRSCNGE